MNLLAIDTAASVFSGALHTEKYTWYFEADAGMRHSELVMDCVDMLMRKAGLTPGDLSALACMGGPGSFTGLRIGFSLAKGLALSLGLPFVPVPTLDCMAYPFAMWPGLVVPVIDAKKNAFFCALYRDGGRIGEVLDAGPAEIAAAVRAAGYDGETGVLLTGPDAETLRERLQACPDGGLPPGTLRLPPVYGGYGRALLELARKELSRRDIAKDAPIVHNDTVYYFSGPEYIRKSDAELQAR
jgi:tRNA threonylcarbamoyladenosine biosynthesis protein TsaB